MSASKPKILLLGGITEAYELAEKFANSPFHVITSLAGRTENPRLPMGEYRIGGFGGISGLIDYIETNNIRLVIDATHPFAATMTEHAYAATQQSKIPLLHLERQKWQKTNKDHWILAKNLDEAAQLIPSKARAFLALGRQHLAPFIQRNDVAFIARMIERPEDERFQHSLRIILAKPGNMDEEMAFLKHHAIDIIIARNSGGERSYSKILAAQALNLPVIMIERAPLAKMTIVQSVEDAIMKTHELLDVFE